MTDIPEIDSTDKTRKGKPEIPLTEKQALHEANKYYFKFLMKFANI